MFCCSFRKLDDKHIMRASSSCCALVKEIRELLGIYENGGATNSISGSRQGSMSPLDSAAESEVSDLSQDARCLVPPEKRSVANKTDEPRGPSASLLEPILTQQRGMA